MQHDNNLIENKKWSRYFSDQMVDWKNMQTTNKPQQPYSSNQPKKRSVFSTTWGGGRKYRALFFCNSDLIKNIVRDQLTPNFNYFLVIEKSHISSHASFTLTIPYKNLTKFNTSYSNLELAIFSFKISKIGSAVDDSWQLHSSKHMAHI